MTKNKMKSFKQKRVTLKEHYSKEVDILNLWWGNKFTNQVESSKELLTSILLDFNKKGEIVGIEIWDFGEALEKAIKRDNEIFKLSEKKKK